MSYNGGCIFCMYLCYSKMIARMVTCILTSNFQTAIRRNTQICEQAIFFICEMLYFILIIFSYSNDAIFAN